MISVSLVLRYSCPLPKYSLVCLLTYPFRNFYWLTNRVPFDGVGGNLFSDGTCNRVGQCVKSSVIVLLLGVVLVIVERMAKLMLIQSALWNSVTVFSFILLLMGLYEHTPFMIK